MPYSFSLLFWLNTRQTGHTGFIAIAILLLLQCFYWLVFISLLAARADSNKECDCFAVFILTHGKDSGKVYGTDGDIDISQLMHPLKNKVLVGKPKMIFIQVCVCCSFVDK